MKPGIYPGLPREEYDAIKAVNWSVLKHCRKSGHHAVLAYRDLSYGSKDSPAKRLGRAIHTAVLEPDKFSSWKVLDQKTTTKDGCITEIESNICKGIVRSLQNSGKELGSLSPKDLFFSPGQREVAIVWTDQDTGLLCKGMVDSIPDGSIWFSDLKTTTDAGHHSFSRDVITYDYAGQMAFYARGLKRCGISRSAAIVAVEKSRPYSTSIAPIYDEALEFGEQLATRYMTIFADTLNTSSDTTTHCYGVIEINIPDWAKLIGLENQCLDKVFEDSI